MEVYRVSGCIQGYGSDADKFFPTVNQYLAEGTDDAKDKAVKQDKMWVEGCTLVDICILESYIDKKKVGHTKGTIDGKEFHIAGECGYCDDAIGNLTDAEFSAIFMKITEEG